MKRLPRLFIGLFAIVVQLNAHANELIDMDISVKNKKLVIAPFIEKGFQKNQFDFRVTLSNKKTGEQLTTPWTSSNSIEVPASLGHLYNIALQSKHKETGIISMLSEDGVSLAGLMQVAPSVKPIITTGISLTNNSDWNVLLKAESARFPDVDLSADISYKGLNFDGKPGQLSLLDGLNFEIVEDGRYESVDRVTQPDPNSAQKAIDIVFVHDDSGSLDDEAAQVKQNITAFVEGLASENFDFRLGLVPYGGNGSFSSSSGTILNNGALTSDPQEFQSYISQMLFNGSREQAFDAIFKAVTESLWRSNTQKVIILVTDENNDFGQINESQVIEILRDNNVAFYGLTANHAEFNRIASAVGGSVFNIRADFNQILGEIGLDLSSRYGVNFASDNSVYSPSSRVVELTIDTVDEENIAISETFTVEYTPAIPVSISLSADTESKFGLGQLPQSSISILAAVNADVAINNVNMFYKNSQASNFSSITMTQLNDGSWSADIPAIDVVEGSIQLYLSANTDLGTVTLPNTDPQASPLVLTVLPNVPPILTHTKVQYAEQNTDIEIAVIAEDATNRVEEISLFYRNVGNQVFKEISNQYSGQVASFSELIPAADVGETDIEYYIEASDDFTSKSLIGSSSTPIVISVDRTPQATTCENYANLKICASSFETDANSDLITASGDVTIGHANGSELLGFDGALIIDPLTSKANALGPALLRALKIDSWLVNPVDLPIAWMQFEIEGNASMPLVTPSTDFSYNLNSILITGEQIQIGENSILIKSGFSIPLIKDYGLGVATPFSKIDVADIELSQLANVSTANVSVDLAQSLPLTDRIGTFGKAMSITLNSFEVDVLRPSAGAAGSINADQTAIGLSLAYNLSPLSLRNIAIEYENKNILKSTRFPLAASGLYLAPYKYAVAYEPYRFTGSVRGALLDQANGLYSLSKLLGHQVITIGAGVTIDNYGKTWMVSGDMQLLSAFTLGSLELTAGLLPSSQYGVNASTNINIVDIVVGDLRFNIQSGINYSQLFGSTDAALRFPKGIPFVGGVNFARINGELLLKIDHQDNNNLTAYTEADLKLAFLKLNARVDFSDPTDIKFSVKTKSSISANRINEPLTINGSNANQLFDIAVPEGEESVFVSVSTSQGLPVITIQTPDGTTLLADDYRILPADFATSTNTTIYYDNADNMATFAIGNPQAGTYKLDVVNFTDLSDVSVDSIIPAVAAQITNMMNPTNAIAGNLIDVSLSLSNVEADTEVEFLLMPDGDQELSISLGLVTTSAVEVNAQLTLPHNLQPDTYGLRAVVRHPDLATSDKISSIPMQLTNAQSPEPVDSFDVSFDNSSASLNWSISGDLPANYIIKVDNLDAGESFVKVINGSFTSFTLGQLTNGDTYRFQIALASEDDILSPFSISREGSPRGNFIAGKPDLRFNRASSQLSSPTENRGDPIIIDTVVENIGLHAAFSARVNCYFDTVSANNLVSSALIGNLEPNESLALSCNIDQSSFSGLGRDVYITITDTVFEETNLANNAVVIRNPYARNVAPDSVDDEVSVNEDTSITIDVLANDSDENGDVILLDSLEQALHGTVSLIDNKVLYTPDANYFGTDSFTYVASDGELAGLPAVVMINIISVNDAPEISLVDNLSISEGRLSMIEATASDVEGDALTISWTLNDMSAALLEQAETLNLSITPAYVDVPMMVVLTLEVSDGTDTSSYDIEVEILNDNTAPELSLSASSSVQSGAKAQIAVEATDAESDAIEITFEQTAGPSVTLSFTDGAITFTAPSVTESTPVSITVSAADAELSSSQSFNFTVMPPPKVDSGSSSGGSVNGQLIFMLLILSALRLRSRRK
jgi:hypothetical protein